MWTALKRVGVFVCLCAFMLFTSFSAGQAHTVTPSLGEVEVADGRAEFRLAVIAEGLVSGINLTGVKDTNSSPQSFVYDSLRALQPQDLAAKFTSFWPVMTKRITIKVDGVVMAPEAMQIDIPGVGDVATTRTSQLRFSVALPAGAKEIVFGWDATYGPLYLIQAGVEKPYDGFLEGGALSTPIAISGGGQAGGWQTFVNYVPVGFVHIVPQGLDHILFVLGLFFLSARLGPLLWQISAFTVAHSIALALAALGYVSVPAAIVEPIIAASIVFVAVENLFTSGLSKWRPFVVFGFGLLHGLGFASVLGKIGLPAGEFVPALIGFNLGVEGGQLFVVICAFLAVGLWFGRKSWYKPVIANGASVLIAIVGSYWVVERTLL